MMIRSRVHPFLHIAFHLFTKLYLVSFRNVGIFHEHAVNRILEDLVKASSPRRAVVKMVFNPRGGITTTVEAEYNEKD